jgi:hypothetical protein
MIRAFSILAASATVLMLPTSATAQETGGTADEAKRMLTKAVAAVKADKTKALDMFNNGESGFRDRDLYVFCFNVGDGKLVATGNGNDKQNIGTNACAATDVANKGFGAELCTASQKPEGEVSEVSYMMPKPGTNATPVAKTSFVTRAADLGCGVGYYK